jgi:uncharacterized caspase-like protein
MDIYAAQHALIIGINDYPKAQNLEGAVNDAKLIRDALRKLKIKPKLLLNKQATRNNIINAWYKMVKQAQPGDTLILTYSGHGSQIDDIYPFDEDGETDETLVLYKGYIRDDELTELFIQASEYKIVFLADSCHSGGLTRATKQEFCRSRNSKYPQQHRNSLIPPALKISTRGDEKETPAHVTYITAADTDNIKICEFTFNNKAHGALTWYFVKALAGEADADNNKRLSRLELEEYLKYHVMTNTDSAQTPKVQPRPDSQIVIKLEQESVKPSIPSAQQLNNITIKIKIENGTAPNGLKHVQIVNKNMDLKFVLIDKYTTDVYNHVGDKIAKAFGKAGWQQIIDKRRLLTVLHSQFNMNLRPVKIDLREENKLHAYGDELHFSIDTGNKRLNALTLFNLTGNGELQFLYPLPQLEHSPRLKKIPYKLPPLGIVPPFGGDNLVAILCNKPATKLQVLLTDNAPHIPNINQIITSLQKQTCQVGQKAFFTSDDNYSR